VVLVDSGDWTMGTVYDLTLATRPLATYFLDSLQYDCATLGNHEFDYTPEGLATSLGASRKAFGFHTPLVASNLRLNGNQALAPFIGSAILPSYTRTLPTGLKVGFLGLMGREAAAAAPNASPVDFEDYARDYAKLQALVTELRDVQGCHVVVALSHAGTDPSKGGYEGEDVDLARNVTGIDVIASGHSHNPFGLQDGKFAHPVTARGWTTQIICAGAFTANVARIDLRYDFASKTTRLVSASNLSMTEPGLAAEPGYQGLDSDTTKALSLADLVLNAGLGTVFSGLFPDYLATDLTRGLYHPVGFAAQDMVSNDLNPVLSPNGLGNLCADAMRFTPNALVSRDLLAAGWNGDPASSTLDAARTALAARGYDAAFFTVGVMPTGSIRDSFPGGSPISFAMAYDTLSLGISPDRDQALPVGFPLMSAYLTYEDLRRVCALQLLSQAGLTPSDYYLNLSGLCYATDPAGLQAFLRSAGAAALLRAVKARADAGNAAAAKALQDLAAAATDGGAALLADLPTNVNVAALATLGDPVPPTPASVASNLAELARIAALGASDAAADPPTVTLNAYLFNRALEAVGPLAAFSPADPACVGTPQALASGPRIRLAVDLYSVLMLGAVQSRFGLGITPYASAAGTAVIDRSDLAGALKNRISLADPGAPVLELKTWMALVQYLTTPPAQGGHFDRGVITGEYKSTPTFTDFTVPAAGYGAAVKVRSASYAQVLEGLVPVQAAIRSVAEAP
jgi:hypothetical protein